MEAKKTKVVGYLAPAVEKAFLMLRFVANASGAVRLSDLSSHLGISKSTAHGLVRALVAAGALNQNLRDKKITMGPAIIELALKNQIYLQLGTHAQPKLDKLRNQINETVFFGLLRPWRALVLATSEADKPMKLSSPPGSSVILMAGALGKVFLSRKKKVEVSQILKEQGLPRFTKASIVEERAFLEEINVVREQGYALDIGEYLLGVNAVAVGIENQYGLQLALWVVGFAESFGLEKINDVKEVILATAGDLQKTFNTV
jgi:DNA-binding IclR family transcriptional regulator